MHCTDSNLSHFGTSPLQNNTVYMPGTGGRGWEWEHSCLKAQTVVLFVSGVEEIYLVSVWNRLLLGHWDQVQVISLL